MTDQKQIEHKPKDYCRNFLEWLINDKYWISGIIVITLLLVLFLLLPKWQVASVEDIKDRIQLEINARATLAQFLGGTAVLITLYLTWRGTRNTELTTTKTLELSLDRQITEGFTRAIDQFGSDKQEIRLGGIYALERIAKESQKDHWTIMEILTTYLREHSPAYRSSDEDETEQPNAIATSVISVEPHVPKLAVDIQAILTVIGRRIRTYKKGETDHLDLFRTNLRNANLLRANLDGVVLIESNLDYATLSGASMQEAVLVDASLSNAKLRYTNLNHANLHGVNLSKANLEGAHLNSAILTQAFLKGANLCGASLIKTNLYRANLESAILIGAKLDDADLVGTNLKGADLKDAFNLTQEQLDMAITDEMTQLPFNLRQRV